MSSSQTSLIACLLFAVSTATSAHTFADVVRLKNGGEIRGVLRKESHPANSTDVALVTLSGATVTLPRSEIESVQPRSPAMEEYITRSREIPHTLEAHQQLADWCVSRQLKPQRIEQLELMLEIEPKNETIHRSLGHIRYEGEWMTREESMERKGFVLHNGKWVTHLEAELLEKTEAERAAEQVWFPKVKQWVGWLGGRDQRRVTDGLTNLRAIKDPDAVAALYNYMGGHTNADYRMLFVQIAGQIKGQKPVRPLARSLLSEGQELIFREILKTIDEDQKVEVVKYCLPGLKDKNNDVVQRAAIVLGECGDERVIPDLIDALITTHRYKVQVPDRSNERSFGIGPNGQPTMLGQGGTPLTNVEMLSRLGQLPYGYTVNDTATKVWRTVTVKQDIHNTQVLSALKKLTEKDFGFDQRDWQRWWAVHQAEG